ncbi:MAG: LysM peptidoglycan-binding domain-containing protein [Chloroflexota bacterium]|nr:LysM peptidoglycan-binding domain-containing protein [Chloroflexota bacterium]
MSGRAIIRAALLLISILLIGTACTKPKPKEEGETPTQPESTSQVTSTMQPTPGQEAVSAGEPSMTPMFTPQVPTAPLPTATPIPTASPAPLPTATPTSIPQNVPTPTPSGGSTTHVVQQGENLFRIGLKHGVPWQDIAQANGIAYPYRIMVGQELAIPRGEAPSAPSGERIHIVKQGENLFRIGLKYGVPWQDIAQANEIAYPYRLLAGQRLVIP